MEGSLSLVDMSKKVEYTFLKIVFEEVCPFFISIGMTYNQFWYDDVSIAKAYLKAFKIKQKRENEIEEWRMWKQGVYTYEALCDVSPVLHAFAKKGTKPLPFPTKPYGIEENNIEKTEAQKEQEAENERLRAIIKFKSWAKSVKKDFQNKAGGK